MVWKKIITYKLNWRENLPVVGRTDALQSTKKTKKKYEEELMEYVGIYVCRAGNVCWCLLSLLSIFIDSMGQYYSTC